MFPQNKQTINHYFYETNTFCIILWGVAPCEELPYLFRSLFSAEQTKMEGEKRGQKADRLHTWASQAFLLTFFFLSFSPSLSM